MYLLTLNCFVFLAELAILFSFLNLEFVILYITCTPVCMVIYVHTSCGKNRG